jgi:hypothetical protein
MKVCTAPPFMELLRAVQFLVHVASRNNIWTGAELMDYVRK